MYDENKELNPLELVSKVTEFNDISQHMNDSDLDETLGLVLKLILKPDVPAKHVAPLIVKLQAMSFKYKMQAKNYMLFDKSVENNKKKNIYMSVSEDLKDLVDALKYLVKNF